MVQLQDKDWHLFRRIGRSSLEAGQPTWEWSESLFQSKRKGMCQEKAESDPPVAKPKPTKSKERAEIKKTREALLGFKHGDDEANATCWCCGVRFVRTENHRFGSLCGSGCLEIIKEVLNEIKGGE